MLNTVLFDMGGTLEDIFVDGQSERAAVEKLREMLIGYGLDPGVPYDELKYCTAKLRNPCSLRLALLYAGRRIELPGDCYGAVWEDQAQKSDFIKVPHHGDPKALTKTLLSRMDPQWAVVSCGEDYIPRKDRPSRWTLELLKDQGTRVWFTDAYAPAGGVPARHRSVDFSIYEDGSVLTPA